MDEDTEAVLSDVEDEDPVVPIVIGNSSSQEEISIDRFHEILAELERERKARETAETAKSDLQVSFNRLKVLAHEAIKKRDESGRQRDEALREKEEALKSIEKLSGELAEAIKLKDDFSNQREENSRQLDELVKARDSSRSEIESTAQMLVTGIEKISGKVSNFKNFGGGLPRSQKYSGLPAVGYGIIKRTNEIVEELLKQIDMATKSRNDAREQMEQRNYEIAIEVSQLEATINGLREDVAKKTSEAENLEKAVADKDAKIAEMDREMAEKKKESDELRQIGEEYDDKLRSLEAKVDSQRPLLIDQLNYISKAHDQLCEIIKMVDVNYLDQTDLSDCLFLPNEMDVDENLRTSLAGMMSVYELSKVAVEKVSVGLEERGNEVKDLNNTVARLVTERQHIGTLLRSALLGKMTSDTSFKTSEVLQVAENGIRNVGIDFRFDKLLGNGENMAAHDKTGVVEIEEDEVYTLAGALEKNVKASQLEIIELQHSVEALRAESNLLKAHVEAQAKDLSQRKQHIKELEEKERVANENVEGLMLDIAAAEEEIVRWKVAAEQEAAAGRAIEQEFVSQLKSLREELEEAKQAILESESKLKFKEETAAAAMAARDTAEKSLRLADTRASRLRERVEELTRQIEELDNREDSGNRNRQRYVCWPWQWLGLNFVGSQAEAHQSSNEMELSEPLL
ncbi:paramyosin [Tasmannia lanceolata]|uniref:paramyosin n=1 Tax=Tasmannia lanceolata TaxID=3420 RepID=UPI004062B41F